MEVSKRDWKLFREKIGGWQENYMELLAHEYIALLQSTDKHPSEKFWELDERIQTDKRAPGVHLELNKDNIYWDIARLIYDKAITINDLDDFSDELKESVKKILNVIMRDGFNAKR